jgi:glycine/D-amino acid oxidase-like deaminating enzyme
LLHKGCHRNGCRPSRYRAVRHGCIPAAAGAPLWRWPGPGSGRPVSRCAAARASKRCGRCRRDGHCSTPAGRCWARPRPWCWPTQRTRPVCSAMTAPGRCAASAARSVCWVRAGRTWTCRWPMPAMHFACRTSACSSAPRHRPTTRTPRAATATTPTTWRCWSAAPAPAAPAPSRQPLQAREIERRPGLFTAFAYGSRGLTQAALAGEVLAGWLTGAAMPVPARLLDAVDCARFAARLNRKSAS